MRNYAKIVLGIFVLFLGLVLFIQYRYANKMGGSRTEKDLLLINKLFPTSLDVFVTKDELDFIWPQGPTYTVYWLVVKKAEVLHELDEWTTLTQKNRSKIAQPPWMSKASFYNENILMQTVMMEGKSYDVYCFTLDLPQDSIQNRTHLFVTVNPEIR